MEKWQRQYYWSMVEFNRGLIIMKDNKVAAIITYFIAFEDDNRFIYTRKPWTIIKDDGLGDTLYIDQILIKADGKYNIFREFTQLMSKLKKEFPNLKRAKWSRASATVRKKGVEYAGTQTKFIVHCKDFKQC